MRTFEETSLSSRLPRLLSNGCELDASVEALGLMRESAYAPGDCGMLRERMASDGYLLLRGLLDPNQVLDARRTAAERLMAAGHLKSGTDPMDCVAAPQSQSRSRHDIAQDNPALKRVLYSGAMTDFFTDFIGEPIKHYDFTWFRAIAPGKGTPPHCDIVYMGRGEREKLYTAWTPIGDIDFTRGGLLVLEGSHKHTHLRETYGEMDVDSFCSNRDGLAGRDHWGKGRSNGWLGQNPPKLRQSLGGLRWVTSEFHAGDVLIFSMYTVHASLDNTSDRVRMSSDSRYQPASKPADERWVGTNPVGHSLAGKRGKVC
jgi:hypothetical protein